MNDPYKILGLESTATEEEIKKAYRKLAMKYHPDRNNGQDKKFKEVKEAYDTVKDGPPVKQRNPFTGHTSYNFRQAKDFADLLREARYRQQMQVSIAVSIPLGAAVTGTTQYMEIPIRGTTEQVEVQIPPGLRNGETIRYPKLVNGVDVTIQYHFINDPAWEVDNINLIKRQSISIWDLVIGTELDVRTIDNGTVRIRIPPGTQPGVRMRIKGKGIPHRLNPAVVGDMLVQLDAKIPSNISPELLKMIKEHTNNS